MGLNWNGISRSFWPASSLNEALLRNIRNRVPKRTIVVRTGNKSWFDNRRVLAHRAKQRTYKAWRRSRTQIDWEENLVASHHAQHVSVETKQAFNELVWSADEKASLFSVLFEAKQYRDIFQQP